MSFMGKILAFYAFLAFAFFMFGVQTPFTQLMAGTGNCTTSIVAGETITVCEENTLLGSIFSVTGALALSGYAAAIVASAIFVPQALIYVIVAPPLMFFVSFFTFPSMIFSAAGVGEENFELFPVIQALFTILNLFFAFAVISWLKGND